VLQSLGLIEKTTYTENKKPAFMWIGLQGVQDFVSELKQYKIRARRIEEDEKASVDEPMKNMKCSVVKSIKPVKRKS
jgi:pimeloyl-CoA synthetase